MSPRDRRQKHLIDLERVLVEIGEFAAGRTETDLLQDRAFQLILEREFEILGEALNRLLRDDPALEPAITHARRIIGLRNLLAHGYDVIDYRILWSAVNLHLPLLKKEVSGLLD
jgi:uncharacterized protein with HEPN domain